MKRICQFIVVLFPFVIILQGCCLGSKECPIDTKAPTVKAQPASEAPKPVVKEAEDTQPPQLVSEISTVATVNGEPIGLGELRMQLFRNRAMIYSYFREKYGAEDSADFWTKDLGGETPLEKIKKESLAECVEIKVQQILGKQKGLNDDITYKTFLERLATENKRRKQAVANKQVIYGPIQYSPVGYYNYIFSNMVIRLKEKLGGDEFKLGIDELKKLYEAEKDQKYKNPDVVTVEKIAIPFVRYKTQSSRLSLDEARAKAVELKARLDKEEDFATIAKTVNTDGTVQQQVFDKETQMGDVRECPQLRNQAMNLPVGRVSGIFSEEDNNTIYLIKCIDRKDAGYMPFEEMADYVKSDYVNEKYDELVKKMIKDAAIVIDHSIYDQIKMRE